MTNMASEVSRRLARNAEAVCRHYLSEGRRSGRYWIIGDVQNTPAAVFMSGSRVPITVPVLPVIGWMPRRQSMAICST